MGDLAEVLGISKGAATFLADGLIDAGLATRRPDQHDRRVIWVVPEPFVATLVEAYESWRQRNLRESLTRLSRGQRQAVRAVAELLLAASVQDEAERSDQSEVQLAAS